MTSPSASNSGREGALPGADSWIRVAPEDAIDIAWEALRGVYDPELYLDVVSLGLVYDIRAEGGALVVEMTMTTPGCPASEILPTMAEDAIAEAVDGAVLVQVRVVWEPPWSPAMIDDEAAAALGLRVR
ncbi:metal-sulfur cluster assembly factor [Aciditerrimonas ferrireducens]|uniref:Metal-sulfur cluster assembly factor n=1 Tax=Aciditerrimonas ferrireducens TaxID=667306 RepID=A0ABV6BZG5_9ACTN